MEFQSIILICVLALCVLTLLIYLLILRSSIREVAEELEEKLQTGNDELTTAVTNISHDLRTPLTAICGYLDLLEQEP